MEMSQFLMQAYKTAAIHHDGQKRKDLNIDYINHPVDVKKRLGLWGVTDENLLAAALLHDTIEDTQYKHEDLRREFGDDVANLVLEVSKPDGANKQEWIHQLALAGTSRAIILKLADRICNTEDFIKSGKKDYAIKYLCKATIIFKRFCTDPNIDKSLKLRVIKEWIEL